jgi:hypothetical protein
MSLYNMINGANPATFFILPMLGKHPDEYPRYRDCFMSDEEHPEYDDHIHIYTRTGGGNREFYESENDSMTEMPEFVTDYDDSFDSTYASWIFRVPEKWLEDYTKIRDGNLKEISAEYRAELYRVYPKLASKFDELFDCES